MKLSHDILKKVITKHPHCEELIEAFYPLLEAKIALAKDLSTPDISHLTLTSSTYPLFEPIKNMNLYFDDEFKKHAPSSLTKALLKAMPDQKEDISRLALLLEEQPSLGLEIATQYLDGSGVQKIAERLTLNADLLGLFAATFCSAATMRVARVIKENPLFEDLYSAENHAVLTSKVCPLCGNKPHGSLLKKQGARFLQCSLCENEWRYTRTACPSCGKDTPSDLPVFYLEELPEERAEACASCNHYILSVDSRALSDDIPLELMLLSMASLDVMMQENGYIPLNEEVDHEELHQ